MAANRRIRVGAGNDARRAQIYNANYMSDGTRYARFDKPWTAFTAIDFRAFKTHAEAITWVVEQMPTPDPAPQEQASVTAGWTPKPDHAAAWQEKWNLTR